MKNYITLLLLAVTLSASAQIPNPKPNTYVNDFANVLSRQETDSLNKQVAELEKETGVQFAMVTIKQLPADMDIEQFSNQLARQWHVGKANNGLVYVHSVGDRKQRLEVAGHLEGVLTDYKCSMILQDGGVLLKERAYYAAMSLIANEVYTEVEADKAEQLTLLKQPKENRMWAYVSVIGLGLSVFFVIAWRERRKKREVEKLRAKKRETFMDPALGRPYKQSDLKLNKYGLEGDRRPGKLSGNPGSKPKSDPVDWSPSYTPSSYEPSRYTPPSDNDSNYGNFGGSSSPDSAFSGGGASDSY